MSRKSSFYKLYDAIFPVSCFVCGFPGVYLCHHHRGRLYKHYDMCYLCHRPRRNALLCEDHRSSLMGVLVSFEYTRLLKEILHEIKYDNAHEMLCFFAQCAAADIAIHDQLRRAIYQRKLCITHVPMHSYKQNYERGYNQSALFAERLSSIVHVPHQPLLLKTLHTDAQATLSREKRLHNLLTAYTAIEGVILQGYDTILIVDDVLTTGSTLQACADIIKKHHPHVVVWGLCIARHAA